MAWEIDRTEAAPDLSSKLPKNKKLNSVACSPQVNYTGRAAAAC
jgi:hypothetical protein